MIRARFKTKSVDDPRPVVWPIKHPYWVSGEGDGYAIIVAYADNRAEVKRLWPDAYDIDADPCKDGDYSFTGRFPKPKWWSAPGAGGGR